MFVSDQICRKTMIHAGGFDVIMDCSDAQILIIDTRTTVSRRSVIAQQHVDECTKDLPDVIDVGN